MKSKMILLFILMGTLLIFSPVTQAQAPDVGTVGFTTDLEVGDKLEYGYSIDSSFTHPGYSSFEDGTCDELEVATSFADVQGAIVDIGIALILVYESTGSFEADFANGTTGTHSDDQIYVLPTSFSLMNGTVLSAAETMFMASPFAYAEPSVEVDGDTITFDFTTQIVDYSLSTGIFQKMTIIDSDEEGEAVMELGTCSSGDDSNLPAFDFQVVAGLSVSVIAFMMLRKRK